MLLGLILFVYGVNNMSQISAVSSLFLVVIGVFLGMAGMLMLTNLFPSFSAVA